MQDINGTWREDSVLSAGKCHGAEDFRGLLLRERERADRLRQPFAVLAFEVGEPAGEEAFWRPILARIRSTDEIGRMGGGRIGVLLRGATVRSAVRLAEEIQSASPFERLACRVYGHPPFEYGLRPGWGPEETVVDFPAGIPQEGLTLQPGEDPVSAVDLMADRSPRDSDA